MATASCLLCGERLYSEDSLCTLGLPCGHTFHEPCLDELAKARRRPRKKLKCPTCNMSQKVSADIAAAQEHASRHPGGEKPGDWAPADPAVDAVNAVKESNVGESLAAGEFAEPLAANRIMIVSSIVLYRSWAAAVACSPWRRH